MAPASEFAQPCGIVVAIVALSRVVRTMATSPMPLCYVTTLSNTVTLCAALSVALGCGEANPALRTSGAGLAVAMMAAFWYLYRVHGRRAVYGDYEPSAYEVLTDHLVLPGAAVALAIGAFRTATCRATLTHLGVLCGTWLVYTHVVRGAHAPPVYPALRTRGGGLDGGRVVKYGGAFGAVALAAVGMGYALA